MLRLNPTTPMLAAGVRALRSTANPIWEKPYNGFVGNMPPQNSMSPGEGTNKKYNSINLRAISLEMRAKHIFDMHLKITSLTITGPSPRDQRLDVSYQQKYIKCILVYISLASVQVCPY